MTKKPATMSIQGTEAEVKKQLSGILAEPGIRSLINISFQQTGPNEFTAIITYWAAQ